MKRKLVKNKTIHIFVLLMLCFACILSFCGCSNPRSEKTVLYVFADKSLEVKLPLILDKFLVTDGKEYELQYVFDEAEVLKNSILSGAACDLLITSFDSVMKELMDEGAIYKDESVPIAKTQMVLIVAGDNNSLFSLNDSLNDLFIHMDPEWMEEELEGYQRYIDFLWETYGEEEWQEEWDDYYDLWIRSDFTGIAVSSLQKEDGANARTILNRKDGMFDLLDRVNFVYIYPSSAEVITAVQEHLVTAGICYKSDLTDAVKVLESYDQTDDPARIYQVGRITGSEHKTEAKELIDFLQGDHARRFFEDFGFTGMR